MSTPSLWQALDDAILAAFDASMGEQSAYATHQLATLEIGDTWTPDLWTLPKLLLVSNSANLSSGAHGGGAPHVTATYSYIAVLITTGATHSAAKQAAQELFRRAADVLRTWPAILANARSAISTQEHPQRLLWDDSRIEIRGRQGANAGQYLGIAVIAFRIETSI